MTTAHTIQHNKRPKRTLAYKVKKEIKGLVHSVRDLFILILPNMSSKDTYRYAFLVHPRRIDDVYRKYPLAKFVPENILTVILRFYWPVVISYPTGLVSQKTGKELKGMVITIPLTAKEMLNRRDHALKKIIQALKLAEKSGAKIIGLGGLTSSLSKGGLDLVGKTSLSVTTGHAYTAYNVTKNVFTLFEMMNMDHEKTVVAVVGAAGSVGSTSAKLIARKGFKHIILIDLARKHVHFKELVAEMKKLNPQVQITQSDKIADIKKAHIIVAATNASEALITSEHVRKGAIIVDDAQPSDVADDVLDRDDVLVIEAGVVHTPSVDSHFNFNLKDKYDNFCCMAEVLVLASLEHKGNYVINRATLEAVDEVSAHGDKIGFRIGDFQNRRELISREKILQIKDIIDLSQ